jgi:truncated hemoglobin YjbI
MPPNALRALNEAERHLASQAGIPSILRPALLQGEGNCRGNAGNVAPIAVVNPGTQPVKVPDSCQGEVLHEFLWNALLRLRGHSIQFAFAAEDDRLWVIYMNRDDVGYVASAPIKTVDGGIRLGDWKIERMPLDGRDEGRESRRAQRVLSAMLQAAESAGMPKERSKAIFDELCGYYRRTADGFARALTAHLRKCANLSEQEVDEIQGPEASVENVGDRRSDIQEICRVNLVLTTMLRAAESVGMPRERSEAIHEDICGYYRRAADGLASGMARAIRNLLAMPDADFDKSAQQYRRNRE